MLSNALKKSAQKGELHKVCKHYAAFKKHTSSPRAIAQYEILRVKYSMQHERTITCCIDLILYGKTLIKYLNPIYGEIAGCSLYAQYIAQLDQKSYPLVFGYNFLDIKEKPMNSIKKKSVDSAFLRDLCYGRTVAEDDRVKHGFEDSTHNACCLLGYKSRAGADATGNPIGKLSESVSASEPFVAKSAMKPWTTCMGSAVCSAYGEQYGDAYMKFAVNPDKTKLFLPPHGTQLSPSCEHYLQESIFGGGRHNTPGVSPNKDGTGGCSASERESILANVVDISNK